MLDFAFNLVVPAQQRDSLGEQRRRREHYEAVTRAWSQRRREYLRRLDLARPGSRLGGPSAWGTSRRAAS
jgi:hypothetical protein